MCSCFPGYAIMADGVSCEGECHGGYSHTCANLSSYGQVPQRLNKQNEGGSPYLRLRKLVREQVWLL